MRPRLSIALLLAAGVILPSQGCVSTVFRPISERSAVPCSPVEPASVIVLSRPPEEPFTVIGEIEAYVTGYYSDEAVLSRLRTEAAQKGAHAIFLDRDVPMMAAESWTPFSPYADNSERAWRKRSSLVYKAALLTEVTEPCPAVRHLIPTPGGLATLPTDARR